MLSVRPATIEDLDALVELDKACFGPDSWSRAQIAGSLALSSTEGWIIDEGITPIAFALIQNSPEAVEILTIGVDPPCRGKGVGQVLLRHIFRRASTRPVFLEVAADNRRAINFYEQAGFRLIGSRRGYYPRPGGAVDALRYRYQPPFAPQASA